MSTPSDIRLNQLTPAAEDGWCILFELHRSAPDGWMLIGGQMVYLLAVEHGVQPIRATDDVDVAVDVRVRPDATRWLSDWLVERGFDLESVSADNIGHRFVRPAEPGPGRVVLDVLAPDHIGRHANLLTRPPARTVEAPGVRQAFARSAVVTVTASGLSGRRARTGQVRRPSVLGALIAKASATTIAVRQNPERDYEDAALLLSLIDDPIEAREDCSKRETNRLRRLAALAQRSHPAWTLLDAPTGTRGRDALDFLLA